MQLAEHRCIMPRVFVCVSSPSFTYNIPFLHGRFPSSISHWCPHWLFHILQSLQWSRLRDCKVVSRSSSTKSTRYISIIGNDNCSCLMQYTRSIDSRAIGTVLSKSFRMGSYCRNVSEHGRTWQDDIST